MGSPETKPNPDFLADLDSLRMERTSDTRGPRPSTAGRRFLSLGAVVLLLALGWLAFRGRGERTTGLTVVHPTIRRMGQVAGEFLSASGYVVTRDRYVVMGARVPGRVESYFVEEGQRVRKGDRLVQLDDRDYRAALARAEAELTVAQANLERAESDERRARALQQNGAVSRQEMEVQETRVKVARGTIDQLEAEVDRARVGLEYTLVRAPADGLVLAKLKEVGEIAIPGGFMGSGDLVRLANLSDIRAEVDVNEVDLNRVHLGQAAQVTPDAYPETHYAGEVVKLHPQVDRQKGTLKIEVSVQHPDARLLPDMSAKVTFFSDEPSTSDTPPKEQLLLPAIAVFRDERAGSFVWVVRDGVAHRTQVEVGKMVGTDVVIASGLSSDDLVVMGKPPSYDGETVTIDRRP